MSQNEDMDIDPFTLIGKKRERHEESNDTNGTEVLSDQDDGKRLKHSSIAATIPTTIPYEKQVTPMPVSTSLESSISSLAHSQSDTIVASSTMPSQVHGAITRLVTNSSVSSMNSSARPIMDLNHASVQLQKIPGHQLATLVQFEDSFAAKTESAEMLEEEAEDETSLAGNEESPEPENDDDYAYLKNDKKSQPPARVILGLMLMFLMNTAITIALLNFFITPLSSVAVLEVPVARHHPQIIPPSETAYAKKKFTYVSNEYDYEHAFKLSDVTLRQFLSHEDGFHLGMAPAFFGFYVYFGALTAFHEDVLTMQDVEEGKLLLPVGMDGTANKNVDFDEEREGESKSPDLLLKSVAGASAGAMAAVLLASGLDPRESAEFASTMTVDRFWDFPGFGGALKGGLFEELMVAQLNRSNLAKKKGINVDLEDGLVPVAVTGFDIFSLQEKVMIKGCMGKAARASATFPLLFQPCQWDERDENDNGREGKTQYLIDGGVTDPYGLVGLGHLRTGERNKRVVNLVAGTFGTSGPIGPSNLPKGLNASEVLSISIEGSPQCGPWAMQNGPRAVETARNAVLDVLDAPMYHGQEEGHYVLHLDASSFVPS